MEYVFPAMWFLVGLILIIRMGRESRVFYPIGAFFLLLGVWWLANNISGVNMFSGVWGLVLRAITAVVLVFSCIVFYKEIKRNREEYEGKNKGG